MYEIIKAEGRVEGHVAGLVEGRVEERRISLLAILDERFSPLPEALKLKLRSVTDYEKLGTLVTAALRSKSLTEFQETL
ncbi:MAG: hypothetical protein IPK32_10595 [Verrucomicrobiaceae bacterium]|nr:hypothetical protein [Verrucomicrobiaceae bacterium]